MTSALAVPIQRGDLLVGLLGVRAVREDSAERRLGWMVAAGSVFLFAGTLPLVRAQWGGFAPWWSVPAATLMAAVVVAAALDPVLPTRAVRWLWRALPPAALLLNATWTLARTDPGAAADSGPWAWQLEPTAVAYATLVWPVRAAAVYSQVSALTVLGAAVATDGVASRALVVVCLAHLCNLAFVVIAAGIRRQLDAVRLSERQVAASVALLATARAEEAEHARLAMIVHDEVLATLNPAVWSGQVSGAPLVEQARRARRAVLGGSRDVPDGTRAGGSTPSGAAATAATVAQWLRARVAALGPAVAVRVWAGDALVPRPAAEALLAAADEAVRNTLRHAAARPPRRQVSRLVEVVADDAGLRVTVSDDGTGFDPAAVDPRRLGVRRSILERMRAVPGGSAEVASRPGGGTTVTLAWRRP